MTSAINTDDLWLVRKRDGVEFDLMPLQGNWTAEQYLKISEQQSYLVEFTDGNIEVLAMPTDKHQVILLFLYELLKLFISPQNGKVLVAPLRVQIRPEKFREPDVLLVRNADDPRRQNRFWLGADLVMEIVSEDDPARDTVVKVADYAEAGILEYWIVNPIDETIAVLTLADTQYRTHGLFRRGDTASSRLLEGFSVDVAAVFDAR
jgi:Uma2 family endonuclease